MARINIEEIWWTDPRRSKLGELLGSDQLADGLALQAWHLAQRFWIEEKNGLIPKHIFQSLKNSSELIKAGLAEERGDFVYVSGTSKNNDWLCLRRSAGSKGGKKSAKRKRDALGRMTRCDDHDASFIQAKSKQTQANASKRKQIQASSSSSSSSSDSKSTCIKGCGNTEHLVESTHCENNPPQQQPKEVLVKENKQELLTNPIHDFEARFNNQDFQKISELLDGLGGPRLKTLSGLVQKAWGSFEIFNEWVYSLEIEHKNKSPGIPFRSIAQKIIYTEIRKMNHGETR